MPEVSSDLSHQSLDLNHSHHEDKLISPTNQTTFEFEFSCQRWLFEGKNRQWFASDLSLQGELDLMLVAYSW
jgi:hypothetical protein